MQSITRNLWFQTTQFWNGAILIFIRIYNTLRSEWYLTRLLREEYSYEIDIKIHMGLQMKQFKMFKWMYSSIIWLTTILQSPLIHQTTIIGAINLQFQDYTGFKFKWTQFWSKTNSSTISCILTCLDLFINLQQLII